MYYTNHNYYSNYQNLLVQDIRNWALKIALSKFFVAITPQYEQRNLKAACDFASALIDIAKPPQTQEGRALTVGTNIYNLSKFL